MPSEHKTNETIKYKLATAMKECMKSASVEKITVTEIVETCGVTRQTFYRNFKDKYDLINWYFDKILLESFEHMGEGKTVYEGLVNKFHYIQQEKLFFKAAFKNDDQNCLRDHDFQLICAFYTEQLETRMACRLSRQLQFQLEMYCQGSIYMTVQWVLGYRKCSAEELAHALASAMPEELQTDLRYDNLPFLPHFSFQYQVRTPMAVPCLFRRSSAVSPTHFPYL